MADRYVRVTKVTHSSGNTESVNEVDNNAVNDLVSIAARVIWLITGLLLLLLAFRFVLALLGANPANVFANFVYATSHPFVAPFFSLFGYDLRYGVSRFELYTLIAMAVYAAIAWALTSVVTLANRPRVTV